MASRRHRGASHRSNPSRRARRGSVAAAVAELTGEPLPPAPRVVPKEPVNLIEPPHAHLVCRRCGRISALTLSAADLALLIDAAGDRPTGWTVDGITYTLTGICPECGAGILA